MSDLHFLTIAEASRLIAARKLSPIELTQAFIARVKALDPRLNAFILLMEDSALAAARGHLTGRQADRLTLGPAGEGGWI